MMTTSSEPTAVRRAAAFVAGLLAMGALFGVVRTAESSLRGKAPAGQRSLEPGVPIAVGDAGPSPASKPDSGPPEPSAARVALGKTIFFDTSLSVPAGTSCASCHDPQRAFAGNHGSTLGVALGSRPRHFAKRSTPSVLYLPFARKFHLHWEEDAPLVDAYGGLFWDGRVDSLIDLVKQPLLNPDEMNGGDAARVAATVASSAYATEFRAEFGDALDHPDAALVALGEAVDAYLSSPAMSPFTSKYDDYVRGKATLTPAEARGLALFKDSAKGGCSACHKMNDHAADPRQSLFTDFSFDAVGAPRNRALPATADPQYFDLGLCERLGGDYKAKTEEFCGRFRTPSLRNVAVRPSYMHNGTFAKLRDVVAFYASRSTDPHRWYSRGVEFDDLPARYRANVNVDQAPYNRHRGDKPALDDAEIDAIVAFLGTLTDAQFR
jgi:cytochrome c peroxidase